MGTAIPLHGASMHDGVAARLRAMVFERELAPGEFIDERRLAQFAAGDGSLMRCYCGQSQPGAWDQRGIVHTVSECRFTDLLITVSGTYRHAELEGEAPTATQACQAVPKARSQR